MVADQDKALKFYTEVLGFISLKALGVVFRAPAATTLDGTGATFEDTCGNLICLHQMP